MRIIDNNTDYYDWLQNVYPDDSLVFDRRDSFLVTKEIFCNHLKDDKRYSRVSKKYKYFNDNFALLQICNTFWLFDVDIIKVDEYDYPTEYKLSLITTWKNYHKPRKMISLDIINFKPSIDYMFGRDGKSKDDKKRIDAFTQAINTNDYKVYRSINRHTICPGDDPRRTIVKHIPLLKACGIAEWIDPLDIYLALEEYFSLEKTASERRDPIGTTDIDRIESHGFDTKTSFRGKQ